jgi:hypothetical protein
MDSVFKQKKPSFIDLESTNVSVKLSHNKNPMSFNKKFYIFYKPITN